MNGLTVRRNLAAPIVNVVGTTRRAAGQAAHDVDVDRAVERKAAALSLCPLGYEFAAAFGTGRHSLILPRPEAP